METQRAIAPHIIPEVFWLNITDHCNNRCLWCYEKDNVCTHTNMSYKVAKLIISSMAAAGTEDCILIGGEPTLHPLLFEFIKTANDHSFSPIIVSNGRAFSNMDYAKHLSALDIKAVNVSLHGWDEKSYTDLACAPQGFVETIKGLRNLKTLGIKIGLTVVLSSFIEGNIDTIVDLISELGQETVEFNVAAPSVSCTGIDAGAVLPIEKHSSKVMEAYRLCQERGVRPGFNLTTPHCLFTTSDLKVLAQNAQVSSGCSLKNGSGVVFTVNGAIATCNHFLEYEVSSPEETQQLLEEERFHLFWNSGEMNEIRAESNCYNSTACTACEHWEVCGGGCPVNWLYFDPEHAGLKPIEQLKI